MWFCWVYTSFCIIFCILLKYVCTLVWLYPCWALLSLFWVSAFSHGKVKQSQERVNVHVHLWQQFLASFQSNIHIIHLYLICFFATFATFWPSQLILGVIRGITRCCKDEQLLGRNVLQNKTLYVMLFFIRVCVFNRRVILLLSEAYYLLHYEARTRVNILTFQFRLLISIQRECFWKTFSKVAQVRAIALF